MGLLSLNLPVIGQSSATEDQKIRDGLASIQTLLNGNVDEANAPNLAAAFTTYKPVQRASAEITAAAAANTYAMFVGPQFATNAVLVGASVVLTQLYLDPADFNANARTSKLRIRATATPNAVAPGIVITAGLYPIATTGGASAVAPTVATIGAVVAGSTAVITTPAASTPTTVTGTDFNFPAAGHYAMGFATNTSPIANSITDIVSYLQVRQV
jgi:hypothetical protein